MLKITIPGTEYFDEALNEFVTRGDVDLELEHSLASLSKWEEKHQILFMGKDEKTPTQILDYVRCMTLTPNVPDEVYYRLSDENQSAINAYMTQSATATKIFDPFAKPTPGKQAETPSAELLYYYMIALNIPLECQYWHLNKLITLIKLTNLKSSPPKKMSKQELGNWMREQNAKRLAEQQTTG